jgi:hypothetical protein
LFVFRYLFIIYFLLLATASDAQKLVGRITDKESGLPLYPVAVTNLNTRITVLCEEDGSYNIDAKTGEAVAFTLMGYKAQQKTVPYSIGVAEVNVQMPALSYTLDEATVIGLTKYQKDSMYRRGTYARPLAARHAGFMSPFSVLAEQFSKKSKRTFKFQQDFYKWETGLFVDSRFTPELVNSLTGLDGDTLAHFMNTNAMPYEYARAATDLELKMWIRSHYKTYMKEERFKQIPKFKDSLLTQPQR